MAFCYLGDARFNMANSYLVVGRQARHGRADRRAAVAVAGAGAGRRGARASPRPRGGRVTITEDVEEAVRGCDFLLTDVWVSMGESDEVWAERIELLMPYQINAADDGADRQPGRQVHALPAGVPQHRHAGRQGDRREVRHARRSRSPRRSSSRRRRSSSTRPRTACTRSRRSWSPRSGADGARRRRPRRQRAAAARAGAVGGQPARERARGVPGARAASRVEHELVISHGNGPQVGLLALQGSAYTAVDTYPLDVLGAQTEGMIGYMLEQELGNELPFERHLATLLTMIEVDPDDPAFEHPTKPIGPLYDAAEAARLEREKGWAFMADGDSMRRAVPVAGAEADLRHPRDPVAARPGRDRDLRRRRRHPDRLRATSRRPPGRRLRRRRGGDRQGPRERAAGDRDRRRRAARSSPTSTPSTRTGARPSSARSAARRRTSSPAREFAAGSMGPKVRAACWFAERTGGFAAIGSIARHPGAAARRGRHARRAATRASAQAERGTQMATTADGSPPTTEAPTWHVLSREGAVQELDVEPERGLTERRGGRAPRALRAEPLRRGEDRVALARVPAPVPGPDADRAAGRRHDLDLPGQAARHRAS